MYSQFMIERLLNEGDHHTLQWLFSTYTMDDILRTVHRGGVHQADLFEKARIAIVKIDGNASFST